MVAYDVWSVSVNNVTDFQIIDYWPMTGIKAVDSQVMLPAEDSWDLDGEGTETPRTAGWPTPSARSRGEGS